MGSNTPGNTPLRSTGGATAATPSALCHEIVKDLLQVHLGSPWGRLQLCAFGVTWLCYVKKNAAETSGGIFSSMKLQKSDSMDWLTGKLTGKPHNLNGKNHGFRLRCFP
jgi:hypothetical protein